MKHYPIDKAQSILHAHGVETQLTGLALLQALNVWTDASGAVYSEWVTVEYTDAWLRDFLNY